VVGVLGAKPPRSLKGSDRVKVKEMCGRVMALFDEVTSFDLARNLDEYRFRIYEAMDSIQRELSVLVSPIMAVKDVTVKDGRADMGDDAQRPVHLKDKDDRNVSFEVIAPRHLLAEDGEYKLYYHKYPERISRRDEDDTAADEMELEISPEAQEAMVYGVCAYLCMNYEPEAYNTYIGRYTAFISNLLSARDSRPFLRARDGVEI